MKRPARLPFLLPILLAPFAATGEVANAQSIQRCTAPDGTSIFTDKGCAAFGARLAEELDYEGRTVSSDVDAAFGNDVGADGLRPVPVNLGDNGAMATGFAMKGCARTQGELIAGVRAAVASGDVNRLSNYYHWTGTSNSTAYALMDRLDRIARNTLAGVQFDYPMPAPERYEYAAASPDEGTTLAYAEPRVYYAGRVALGDRPSTFAAHRPVDDDVATYGSGIVDASTPLAEAKPAIPSEPTPTGPAAGLGARYAPTAPVLTGAVDASTPLDEARATTLAYSSGNAYNPQPVALRVNMGGGTGTRFNLRQNAGCWFISF